MYTRMAVVLVSLVVVGAAQAERDVRYRELLANGWVRVYGLELAQRQTAALYQNTHDLLWIALDDSSLTLLGEDTGSSSLKLHAGDVRLLPSYSAKRVRNDSPLPSRTIVVELLQRGVMSAGCGCLDDVEKAICGCARASHLPELWAFALGKITLAGTALAAGQSFTSSAARNDMLLVALTPTLLRDEAGADTTVTLDTGSVAWINSGNHKFKNAGQQPARFITIEF